MSDKKYKPQLIARESAIKILYQMKMNDISLDEAMSNFIEKRTFDEKLLSRILNEYVTNKDGIISLLNNKTDISFESIPVLDLCIIHLSICEFLFINKTKNIIINEYINIAKKYSSPKMYTFLNKILDNAL
mgnify:CR=1 FL=1|tara:strand:+ start:485 stop:877 length:393 start_codon:yes stop_codon:yes gene_type:complete